MHPALARNVKESFPTSPSHVQSPTPTPTSTPAHCAHVPPPVLLLYHHHHHHHHHHHYHYPTTTTFLVPVAPGQFPSQSRPPLPPPRFLPFFFITLSYRFWTISNSNCLSTTASKTACVVVDVVRFRRLCLSPPTPRQPPQQLSCHRLRHSFSAHCGQPKHTRRQLCSIDQGSIHREATPGSSPFILTEPRRYNKLSANPTPSAHDSSVAAPMQRACGTFAAIKKTSSVRLFSQSLSNNPPSEQRSRVIGSATLCVVNIPDPQI
ncbi:hypothetical protein CcaCcLH18_04021 [Colletotrichum camelliae]|nr:hypothetical protein CcaCcLH18_04021 [Colletotrichum camelliae]